MKNCPYCLMERKSEIQPHYMKLIEGEKETWVAYCPRCGACTPPWRNGAAKSIDEAKTSWNSFDLPLYVDASKTPMQTFSPD